VGSGRARAAHGGGVTAMFSGAIEQACGARAGVDENERGPRVLSRAPPLQGVVCRPMADLA